MTADRGQGQDGKCSRAFAEVIDDKHFGNGGCGISKLDYHTKHRSTAATRASTAATLQPAAVTSRPTVATQNATTATETVTTTLILTDSSGPVPPQTLSFAEVPSQNSSPSLLSTFVPAAPSSQDASATYTLSPTSSTLPSSNSTGTNSSPIIHPSPPDIRTSSMAQPSAIPVTLPPPQPLVSPDVLSTIALSMSTLLTNTSSTSTVSISTLSTSTRSTSTLSTSTSLGTVIPQTIHLPPNSTAVLSTSTSSMGVISISESPTSTSLPKSSTTLLPHTTLSLSMILSTTTSSTKATQPTNPTLITALSITAAMPTSLAPFFPKSSSNTNVTDGLGPESASGKRIEHAGGIVAGIILGVVCIALLLALFLFRRYKKRREHRQSIGSPSLYGDNDKAPILGSRANRGTEKGRMGEYVDRPTSTSSPRSKDQAERYRGNGNGTARRDEDSPTSLTAFDKMLFGFDFGGAGVTKEGKDRPITLPAMPIYAPLRANRSSSIYSGSLFHALSGFEEDAPRLPNKSYSLNLSSPTTAKDDGLKRSASEADGDYKESHRASWRIRKSDGRDDQFSATLEDFQRIRNHGEGMRRGRPVSDGEMSAATTATMKPVAKIGERVPPVPPPPLVTRMSDEPGVLGGGEIMRIYKEPSFDRGLRGRSSNGRPESKQSTKGDDFSGRDGFTPSAASSGGRTFSMSQDESTRLSPLGLRGSDMRGSLIPPSNIRPSRGVGYGGFTYALPDSYGLISRKDMEMGKGKVLVQEMDELARNEPTIGEDRGFDVEEQFEVGDEVGFEDDDYERMMELKRNYKGKIRFGMGVQKRYSAQSLWKMDVESAVSKGVERGEIR